MNSFPAQNGSVRNSMAQSRRFGRDLTNFNSDEENSLDNIKGVKSKIDGQEIQTTLQQMRRANQPQIFGEQTRQQPQIPKGHHFVREQLLAKKVPSNAVAARQNIQRQEFENDLPKLIQNSNLRPYSSQRHLNPQIRKNSQLGGPIRPATTNQLPEDDMIDEKIQQPKKLEAEEDMEAEFEERVNTQIVETYQADIFDHCMKREIQNICHSDYFELVQTHISDKMRSILMDWLIDVLTKFNLRAQTYFMTVNIIDRFLESYECPRDKLQLVGITAMFIACKYEEIYPPELAEFVVVCDRTYTDQEIIEMENNMIIALNFNLVFTSSFQYHEMFCQKLEIDPLAYEMGKFLLFISTLEFGMNKFKPSKIALCAIYLSNKFMKQEKWKEELPHVIGCSQQEVKEASLELFLLIQKTKQGTYTAALRKFANKQHLEVSKLPTKL